MARRPPLRQDHGEPLKGNGKEMPWGPPPQAMPLTHEKTAKGLFVFSKGKPFDFEKSGNGEDVSNYPNSMNHSKEVLKGLFRVAWWLAHMQEKLFAVWDLILVFLPNNRDQRAKKKHSSTFQGQVIFGLASYLLTLSSSESTSS